MNFTILHIEQLDGKYSESVQLPVKATFGVYVANTWHTYD